MSVETTKHASMHGMHFTVKPHMNKCFYHSVVNVPGSVAMERVKYKVVSEFLFFKDNTPQRILKRDDGSLHTKYPV